MKRTLLTLVVVFSLLQATAFAQTKAPTPVVLIKAGRLIDVRAGRVVENQGIIIEGERIKTVGPLVEVERNAPSSARVIDLSRATLLPGLADCHTHILLQFNRARFWPRRRNDGSHGAAGNILVPHYLRRSLRRGRPGAAGAPIWLTMRDIQAKAFPVAVRKGVKIAYGTDAGGYAWTENQAKEFAYMVRYGMTPLQAIQSATIVAADLLERPRDLGAIEVGKFDIIAVSGDPLRDITELERVRFVMKGGEVFRNEITR